MAVIPPAIDSYQHFNAIKELLLPTLNQHVYEWGQVPGRKNAAGTTNPGTAPSIYVLLAVERRFADTFVAGRAQMSAWRIAAVSVGRTPGEVRWAQLSVATALESVRLVVAGHTTTPVAIETPGSPQPDEPSYSARDSFTYAL